MRFSILLLGCMVAALSGQAQTKAVTESGDEVILYKDGTWKAAGAVTTPSWNTRLDTPVFKKGPKSTFLVKGKRISYGVWIDPKKWSFSPPKDEASPVEYRFLLKKEDAYCMVIPEGIGISMESLQRVTLENTKKIDPEAHITREETRNVNGRIVKMIETRATVEGIKFVYYGYYFTSDAMTLQLIGYTSESLWSKYKGDFDELLNGLVIEPK